MYPKGQRALWELTRGQRWRYSRAILALALSNVFLFGVPLVTRTVLDSLNVQGEEEGATAGSSSLSVSYLTDLDTAPRLWAGAFAILLLTALGGLFVYLRSRWSATASEAIVRSLRNRLYAHLNAISCSYLDQADTGDLVQRCTSDVETVRVFLSNQVVEIGRVILLLVMVLPILTQLDGRMTLVSLALFPVIVTVALVFFGRVKQLFRETDEAEGRMTTVLQENLTGIRVVRAFARQDYECDKFGARNAEHRDLNARLIRVLGRYWGGSDLLCFAQIGIVLFCGAHWLRDGSLSVGTLFAFLLYQGLVIWPVRQLGRVLADTGKAVVALGRLEEVLSVPAEDAQDEVVEGDVETATLERSGHLQIEGLSFRYDGKKPAAELALDAGASSEDEVDVIKDVSLEVEPGTTLALLGPPGSGKSTLVHLLLRLYGYDRGSIRLDGRELKSLSRRRVRSQIGAVLQEPFLYSRTVRANLQIGRTGASEDDLVGSTTAACIHSAIQEFTDGYDTLVGERGVTLSGGQRQRVALARALLKDPAVLVLDDSLSAVDTDTESRILEALRRRKGRRTTIIIAHRISSVLHADQVLVLDEGRIAQRGKHAELIEVPGPYQRLWQIQGALEDQIEADLRQAARGGK